ncbi:MAG: FHA domain-containing protein, partial [Acidobacteriota bacterium]
MTQSEQESRRDGPHLILQDPEGNETFIALGHSVLSLGRRTSNELQVLDPTVSREHATVGFEDGSYWVEDLESTNGTFVNDCRVSRQKLQHNDRLRLGKTGGSILVFRTHQEISDLLETAEDI